MESLLDVIARARNGDVAGEGAPEAGYDIDPSSSIIDISSEEDIIDAFGEEGEEEEGEELEVDGASSGALGGGDGGVWTSPDHAATEAVEGLRAAAAAAVAAAELDADPNTRAAAMGRLLAHLSLHVSMAAEGGEFAMRDVVAFAIETVENDGK